MRTFHIKQFGCRATQADAGAIKRQLLERGYTPAPEADCADVVVLNTCTVTAAADFEARHAIGAIHRTNPRARIVVTGCYAQRAPEELARLDGVSCVVGNAHQPEIPDLLEDTCDRPPLPKAGPGRDGRAGFVPLADFAPDMSWARAPASILTGNLLEQTELVSLPLEGGESGHTRPILKIQDGCNHRCSYCVIPFVRGPSRSLPPTQLIEQVRKLAARGYREVVLSGIDLGSYGRDLVPRVRLTDVVRRIIEETPLERLRLSSIEPKDVTGDLVELFASTARIARHFHIPLQSGSDRILAAMHRWYRTAQYTRRIELIRECLPDAGIGADVISGFPGETEDDHNVTLRLLEQLPLSYLHVFSFSKRPGTRAAEITLEVPRELVKQRSRALRALAREKSLAFSRAHLGRRLRVLTLDRTGQQAGGSWTGALSGNYLNVRVAGAWPPNQMLDVVATGLDGSSLVGEPL